MLKTRFFSKSCHISYPLAYLVRPVCNGYILTQRLIISTVFCQETGRRVHLSTRKPYRAAPKAGAVDPKGTLKLGLSGAHSKGTLGGLLGPASSAIGPALSGLPVGR